MGGLILRDMFMIIGFLVTVVGTAIGIGYLIYLAIVGILLAQAFGGC